MASLVPDDLEICRACALLVFFLERSVEAYKMVYILYMHPDQEYHVDCCPIGNRIRFETLQALKKDLYFDPEFWNLIALRTNCLKLMSEKVLSAALEEIMEEKWVPSHCRKETISSRRSKCTKENAVVKKNQPLKGDRPNHKDAKNEVPKKKVGRPRLNKEHPLKKKGNQGTKQWKKGSSEPMRRSSFWQLDRLHHNRSLDYRENKRTTRHSERVPAKRMIRTPKWLLEDSGTLDKNAPPVKRHYFSLPYLPLRKRTVAAKNSTKEKEKSEINVENDKEQERQVPIDSQKASNAPQVVLELSLPDNELLGTFTDESCNRHSGLPQKLFYKSTVKIPSESLPEKVNQSYEVILKAQDARSFCQLLHCYARKPKGKKNWTKTQGSSSTITRSAVQLDASDASQLGDKPAVEMKVTISSQTPQLADKFLQNSKEKLELHESTAITKDTETAIEPKVTLSTSLAAVSESAVEVEVKVAAEKNRHSPRLESMNSVESIIPSATSKLPSPEKKTDQISDSLPPTFASEEESKHQESIVTNEEELLNVTNGTPDKKDDFPSEKTENSPVPKDDSPVVVENSSISESEAKNTEAQTMDNTDNLPSLTVEPEKKSEITPNQEEIKSTMEVNNAPTESKTESDDSKSLPTPAPPPNTALESDGLDPTEPECEESKLEFCCHFCCKDVKGRLLVAHAMFHYRKDECMFCGVTFRNNLKAMIHLSNHLEKLKKLQNPTAVKSPEKSRTKDKHELKTGKAKASDSKLQTVLNEKSKCRKNKPIPPVRKLRSSYKFRHTMKQDQGSSKDLKSKAPLHKVNGHIGKRNDNIRIANNLITKTRLRQRSYETGQSTSVPIKVEKEESLLIPCASKEKGRSKASKQKEISKNIDSLDKLCCPVDGCQWFTVKKQVALFVYHALEEHYSDSRPLELAFSMSNNKCSICKRVLYGFEHFQHHVDRHKLVPRHPCPHKGCTARFKTTIEMRRHARKHSPLQAMCCLPGCPKLFICLWQLILHEKDHYSKRSKATRKDKPEGTQIKQEKQEDQAIKAIKQSNKTVSSISISKTHSNDTKKTKDSTVPKKKISAQSAAATRLLQKLRKRQIIKNNQASHKMISSVGKPNSKLKHSLQKKGNKSIESCKVLPPRLSKNSQNDSSKSNQSGKDSKTPLVRKRKEEAEKNTDEGNVKRQKVAKISSTEKTEKRKNYLPKSERTKYAEKTEKLAAPIVDSPVVEENAHMDTTDAVDRTEPFSDTQSSNDISDMMEQETCKADPSNLAGNVACQSELSVMSKSPSHDSAANVKEVIAQNVEVVENVVTDTSEKDITAIVEKCESELAERLNNLKQDDIAKLDTTDSSEISPVNQATIVNTDVVKEVITEEVTGEENSCMADTVSSSNPPSDSHVIASVKHNVASPQNAGTVESRVGATEDALEPIIVTTVPESENKVESVEDLNNETKMADASVGSADDTAFESSIEGPAPGSILDKMENTDLAANDQLSPSSIIASKLEQVERTDPVTAETEGASTETSPQITNEPVSPNERRNRPKMGNKNEILSALKTLVKSKKDKIEIEGSGVKRKIEFVDEADANKSKSETQPSEVEAASVVASSASEEKMVETKDSAVNVNEMPTEKSKEVRIRRKIKVNVKVKSNSANKVVKKQTKIEKKPKNTIKEERKVKKIRKEKSKSEAEIVKPKSTSRKKMVKTSTKPEVSCSSVNGEPKTTEGSVQQCNSTDAKTNKSSLENVAEPKITKKDQAETCIKDHTIFNFVPMEEESPLATFEKVLSEYKKNPYMRLPATAYLEERFTVMPKRRKDMSMYFGSSRKVPKIPEETEQVVQPKQRQRCANCFTTFNSDDELQWHLQQKCSSLFGFDSDEEGTS